LNLFAGIMFLSSVFPVKMRRQIIMVSSCLIICISAWSIIRLWNIHREFVVFSDGSIGPFLWVVLLQLLIMFLFAINIFGARFAGFNARGDDSHKPNYS
jgi:hypothetical protein